MMIIEDNIVIVLNGVQRNEIAELLLSIARWCLYGANYRERSTKTCAWTISASKDAFSYIGSALASRRAAGFTADTLAREMKSLYTGFLSQVKVDLNDPYEKALAASQLIVEKVQNGSDIAVLLLEYTDEMLAMRTGATADSKVELWAYASEGNCGLSGKGAQEDRRPASIGAKLWQRWGC
jgi:hypothetical protein